MSALHSSLISTTKSLAKSYCLLKLKHELQLKQFKEPFDIELSDLVQNIMEEGISIRNIDNHRTAYEKLVNTYDYSNHNVKKITPGEQSNLIFELMLSHFGRSNNSFASQTKYLEARDNICKYFTRYFESKEAIVEFKLKQSNKLMIVKDEIHAEGIPLPIITYIFKRMKADLNLLNITSKEELDYSGMLYNEMKVELLEESKNVQA